MAVTNNELHNELVYIRELLENKIVHLGQKVDSTSNTVEKLDITVKEHDKWIAKTTPVIEALKWATGFAVTLVVGYIATKLFALL